MLLQHVLYKIKTLKVFSFLVRFFYGTCALFRWFLTKTHAEESGEVNVSN